MTNPIEQLRRLAEARKLATAGEWKHSYGRNELAIVVDAPCRSEDQVRYGDRPVVECEMYYDENQDAANQQFIIDAANTDFAAMLAEWEKDRAERDEYKRSWETLVRFERRNPPMEPTNQPPGVARE